MEYIVRFDCVHLNKAVAEGQSAEVVWIHRWRKLTKKDTKDTKSSAKHCLEAAKWINEHLTYSNIDIHLSIPLDFKVVSFRFEVDRVAHSGDAEGVGGGANALSLWTLYNVLYQHVQL